MDSSVRWFFLGAYGSLSVFVTETENWEALKERDTEAEPLNI